MFDFPCASINAFFLGLYLLPHRRAVGVRVNICAAREMGGSPVECLVTWVLLHSVHRLLRTSPLLFRELH